MRAHPFGNTWALSGSRTSPASAFAFLPDLPTRRGLALSRSTERDTSSPSGMRKMHRSHGSDLAPDSRTQPSRRQGPPPCKVEAVYRPTSVGVAGLRELSAGVALPRPVSAGLAVPMAVPLCAGQRWRRIRCTVPTMENVGGAELLVVWWILGLVSLYLVIRAAVRGGVEDAWKRRAKRERSSER